MSGSSHAEMTGRIDPELRATLLGRDWPDHESAAIRTTSVTLNGTDDLGANRHLYRTARAARRTVEAPIL
jgi:hypothetical protein